MSFECAISSQRVMYSVVFRTTGHRSQNEMSANRRTKGGATVKKQKKEIIFYGCVMVGGGAELQHQYDS